VKQAAQQVLVMAGWVLPVVSKKLRDNRLTGSGMKNTPGVSWGQGY
jgi:hypothetical protein